MVSVVLTIGTAKNRTELFAAVGTLAVNVSDPIVTVAPLVALFAETVPTARAFAVMPSGVVPVVQEGVVVPLCPPATPHPPVHS